MDLLHVIVLALLQGLTEFLPISSAAHLILLPRLLGWEDQGLAFDVAVHVGTLAAVMVYFRKQLIAMARDWSLSLTGRSATAESRLAWGVIVATVPIVIAGFLLKDAVETTLRSPLVIAAATIVFGLILWWADRLGKCQREEGELRWRDAVFIGLAQVIALIPGTSRSGITMTAGLMLGLTRQAAARFSFLLSIPTILGAGLLKTKDLLEATIPVDWTAISVGIILSGVSAYLCIEVFLKVLDRIGMLPFVIYRLVLGVILVALFW